VADGTRTRDNWNRNRGNSGCHGRREHTTTAPSISHVFPVVAGFPIFPRLGVPRVSSLRPDARAALLARKEIDRTDVQVACDLGLGGSVAKAVEVLRYPRVMQTGRKRELRELGLG